jgi:hypothetical protein
MEPWSSMLTEILLTSCLQNCTTYTTAVCKAVPLQAWSGPGDSGKLRFPDFMIMAQDGREVVSPMHRLHLPPGNSPGTHFY